MLSLNKIKKIIDSYKAGGINYLRLSKHLHISRTTLKKYVARIKDIELQDPELINYPYKLINQLTARGNTSIRYLIISSLFPSVLFNINNKGATVKSEWFNYKEQNDKYYRYSQFSTHFLAWLKENKLKIDNFSSYHIKIILKEDLQTLKKWRKSTNRKLWGKAVVIIDRYNGHSILYIEKKIECSHRKINSWIKAFNSFGIKGLESKPRKINDKKLNDIKLKKSNLIKLIHETPKNYGINRASWSLGTLSEAYLKKYDIKISRTTVSEYIKSEGYGFRKAKKTLTSPDPKYREKLENITNILSNLKSNERFFSVDEFGPFSVKIQGGRSIVKKGTVKTFPQWQRSKGRLICTAALELSTNQITHFYSTAKNTDEMIKLLDILLNEYKSDEKIYFSWDAASWHASKKLKEKIKLVNSDNYRSKNHTPFVELAPLPASAQFLNVIESVFSGLSKSIIHNSNYESVEECKNAINLYFKKRNEHFLANPKKAGNKIWKKEKVIPKFDEKNNCKDSKWR